MEKQIVLCNEFSSSEKYLTRSVDLTFSLTYLHRPCQILLSSQKRHGFQECFFRGAFSSLVLIQVFLKFGRYLFRGELRPNCAFGLSK